jgi:retron-type reverse transcriptase
LERGLSIARQALKLIPRKENISMALLETILSRPNLLKTLKRVEGNKGAPGIDGVSTEHLREHIREHWPAVKQQLLKGTYQPAPVRRVEIPKPNGGIRLLGIPTVMDRLIQQAILQGLTLFLTPTSQDTAMGFVLGVGLTRR